jgi:hypothetical protein
LAVLLAGALGFAPTRSVGGDQAVLAMFVACGLSAIAAIAGSLPVALAAKRAPDKVPAAALGATMLRLSVLVVLAVPVAFLVELNLRALLVWVGISYLAALAAEVVALLPLVRRTETHR